jgi:phosphatidylethanolamine/phosphatidyl-N-methylethanolamine N-methyltransferase
MNKSSASFYNVIAHFYPLIDFFLDAQKPILAAEINTLSASNILEIGVGNGKHIPLFEKHQFTGIDTSAVMLKKASENKLNNVELIEMDGEHLSFSDQSFDHVILSHIITVANNPTRLLEEAFRVTRKGGKLFVLNHFTPDNWLGLVDKSFDLFSGLFHFKSLFYKSDLKLPAGYILEKEIKCTSSGYYKLLVYTKS